jgi:uncharacterized ubiquitin-like protein YukD
MKVDLKTLKGVTFSVEAAPDMLVSKVKELAAASEMGTADGWEAEGIKLIFQGKVLENGRDLASYSIAEGDFMVLMASKPKKPAAAAPSPVSVSEADQENVPVPGLGISPSYGSMPVAELRRMLEAAKLPSTGTKSDLVARLQRHSTGGAKRHRSPTKAKRPQSDPVSLEPAGAPLSPSTKIPLATRSTSMNRA